MNKRAVPIALTFVCLVCYTLIGLRESKVGQHEAPTAASATTVSAPQTDSSIKTQSKSVQIVTWNGRELFDAQEINRRTSDFKNFSNELQPDILMLQEVTSLTHLESIRDKMNLKGYHVCCSDFFQNDNERHQSFEVGVISRFPFTSVIENDPSPDNKGKQGEPKETRLKPPRKPGLKQVTPGRGFLRVQIEELKLILNVTHLKSANGKTGSADFKNAQKREVAVAAIAAQVNRDRKKHPDYAILVAGDFNIGETDKAKNGTSLTNDDSDGYDDTHAILHGGLIDNLRMTSLTKSLGRETYNSKRLKGTGPIDCIYVVGKKRFSKAQIANRTHGSDHFAVATKYQAP